MLIRSRFQHVRAMGSNTSSLVTLQSATLSSTNPHMRVLGTSDIISLVIGIVTTVVAIFALINGWKCWSSRKELVRRASVPIIRDIIG